jgi:hypothetical protein
MDTASRLFGKAFLGSSAEAARDRDKTPFRRMERSLEFKGQLEDEDIRGLFLAGKTLSLGLDVISPPSRSNRKRGEVLHSMPTRSSGAALVSGGLKSNQENRKRRRPVIVDTDEDDEGDNDDADDGPYEPAMKGRKEQKRSTKKMPSRK